MGVSVHEVYNAEEARRLFEQGRELEYWDHQQEVWVLSTVHTTGNPDSLSPDLVYRERSHKYADRFIGPDL